MSRQATVLAYAHLYSSILSGLLSSASYNQISGDANKIEELLDTADAIAEGAIDRHLSWIHTHLGDLDRVG